MVDVTDQNINIIFRDTASVDITVGPTRDIVLCSHPCQYVVFLLVSLTVSPSGFELWLPPLPPRASPLFRSRSARSKCLDGEKVRGCRVEGATEGPLSSMIRLAN